MAISQPKVSIMTGIAKPSFGRLAMTFVGAEPSRRRFARRAGSHDEYSDTSLLLDSRLRGNDERTDWISLWFVGAEPSRRRFARRAGSYGIAGDMSG